MAEASLYILISLLHLLVRRFCELPLREASSEGYQAYLSLSLSLSHNKFYLNRVLTQHHALHSPSCSPLTIMLSTHHHALHSPSCSPLTIMLSTHHHALHSPSCSPPNNILNPVKTLPTSRYILTSILSQISASANSNSISILYLYTIPSQSRARAP
jgi:hypothetical protein